jgi:hypothetical protein
MPMKAVPMKGRLTGKRVRAIYGLVQEKRGARRKAISSLRTPKSSVQFSLGRWENSG